MLRTVTRLRVSLQSIQRTLSSISPPLSQISPPLPTRTHTKRADPYPLTSILSHPYSSRRRKNNEEHGEDDGDGLFVINRDRKSPPKLFVLQPRLRPDTLLQSKLSEALNLANSLEEQRDEFCVEEFGEKEPPPHLVVQNPVARSLRALADTYFGPGTVESIKCHLNSLDEEDGIDAVFVNAILSGIQQRNLERAWGKPVLDRVGLIIEIFNAHAQTKEAKLQSELAALMYKRTRLVRFRGPGGRLAFGTSGEAEVVSARGRGSGGRGFISGAGETELQLQRRSIQERRSRLLSQIEEVRRTRALQRAARKRHGSSQDQGLATVAVVGYTNAGKSTLVSALSQCDLYSDNRLFATVDPLLRSVNLPSGRKALLSDTVGFISDLPVQLVEAFHATLEEVIEADLLVHVLDSSAENLDEQRSTVLQVLQQIGVSEEKIQNMIEVWNKIDILDGVSGAYAHDDGDLEESEDVGGSFTEEDITTELSSPENIDEDDLEMEADEALDKGEDLLEDEAKSGARLGEKEDALEAFSPGEHTDEDVLASISSPPEKLETADGQKDEFLKDWKMTVEPTQHQSNDVQHMRTSALTGVGLQELLNLIDEKLSAQKPLEKRGSEYFNRKWRPSYATDDGRVAEK